MKTKQEWLRNPAMVVLLPAAVMVLASCASKKWELAPPPQTQQQESGSAGFGGQTYSTSVTTTSTVVSVDAAHRTLELKPADGTATTYKAGPEVANFDQIKVGARVTTTLAEERTVGFAVTGASLSDKEKSSVVQSVGGGPVIAVTTRNVTAKVLAVDYSEHSVTLQVGDGKTVTVKAGPNTNLAVVNPGDTVSVQISQARTFSVEKP